MYCSLGPVLVPHVRDARLASCKSRLLHFNYLSCGYRLEFGHASYTEYISIS
jgi:hypothetical protein